MILCADDYGLRPDINRAILTLSGAGQLTAVSCMVVLERCTAGDLTELKTHESSIDLGLHVCLTEEGLPLSKKLSVAEATGALPSFETLLWRCLRGQVSREVAMRDIAAQYDLFVQKCGKSPDYIDGHLHVHELPGIREGLIEFVGSLSPAQRPYIRNTRLPIRELRRRGLPWLKSAFIGLFGARMVKELRRAEIETNTGFAGIYDFGRWREYGDHFPRFLECVPAPNGLMVVHPGGEEDWRKQEFAVLEKFSFGAGKLNRFQRKGGGRIVPD